MPTNHFSNISQKMLCKYDFQQKKEYEFYSFSLRFVLLRNFFVQMRIIFHICARQQIKKLPTLVKCR